MQINEELKNDLLTVLNNNEPKKGEIRFEQAGNGLMFKILNEKDIHLSAVFGGTLIVDFDVMDIANLQSGAVFYTSNYSVFLEKYADELLNAPTNYINDRECELLLATIDGSREDNLIIVTDKDRQLKSDYKSANGGWILQYANGQRTITFGKGVAFIFDAVDVNKKYVKLYDSQNSDTRIYLSRSKVSPF